MRQRKFNSRALRRLAEELFQQIVGDGDFPEGEREDFVTSLVRQWITYDGNATLFLGERRSTSSWAGRPSATPASSRSRAWAGG